MFDHISCKCYEKIYSSTKESVKLSQNFHRIRTTGDMEHNGHELNIDELISYLAHFLLAWKPLSKVEEKKTSKQIR